jgi:hypothetical protein
MDLRSEHKTCKSCAQSLPSSSFYQGKQRSEKNPEVVWTFLDSMCKPCRGSYHRLRRRDRKRQIIEFLGGQCQDCGLVDLPEVYDCHHKDGSDKDFSIASVKRRFESIKAELEKCVLLCANCHRRRHYS